jgi:hypothetical protein
MLLTDEGLVLVRLEKLHPPFNGLKSEGVAEGSLFSLEMSCSDDDEEERKRLIVPNVRISPGVIESGLDFLALKLVGLGERLKGFRMLLTVKERECGLDG